MGLKAGLNPDILYEVMSSGGASSDQLASRGRDMLAGNYATKSSIWVATKDTDLSLELGKRLGVVLPVGALFHQFYLNARHRGWDQKDATIVMRIFEELANFKRESRRSSSKPMPFKKGSK